MTRQTPTQITFGYAPDLGTVTSSHQIPLYPIPLQGSQEPPLPTAIDVRGDLPSITEALVARREYEAYCKSHQHLMVWMHMDHGYRHAISEVRRHAGLSPLQPFDLKQCAAYPDGYTPDVYQTHLETLKDIGQRQRRDTQAAERDLIKRIHEQ